LRVWKIFGLLVGWIALLMKARLVVPTWSPKM
jgi:hypothetical protein